MDKELKTSKKSLEWFLKGGFLTILGVLSYFILSKNFDALSSFFSSLRHKSEDYWVRTDQAWQSIQSKAVEIEKTDESNTQLRIQNALLRKKLESFLFQQKTAQVESFTQKKEVELLKETGSQTGLSLKNLTYKLPSQLSPSQLYTLGVSYFKAHEDEKAAVIFSYLINQPQLSEYHTAIHYLATGMTWYRLQNYFLADLYFTEVLRKPEEDDSLPYQAKARLWKALVATQLGKKLKAQYWLKELIDHHPKAPEISFINPKVKTP